MLNKIIANGGKIIEAFKNEDVIEKCSLSTFPRKDMPSNRWSLFNRWLCLLQAGEVDCRGFNQWKEVNRHVKKGSKAVHILKPIIKNIEKDGEKEQRLCGFRNIPVFSKTDTDGDPLKYENIPIPELPLMEIAEKWGINIITEGFNDYSYGSYIPAKNEIRLSTNEISTFFHELIHVAHNKINKLKLCQDPAQEIIAEFGAAILCHMVTGESPKRFTLNYIEQYAKKINMSIEKACLSLLHETAKVINLILSQLPPVKVGDSHVEGES